MRECDGEGSGYEPPGRAARLDTPRHCLLGLYYS